MPVSATIKGYYRIVLTWQDREGNDRILKRIAYVDENIELAVAMNWTDAEIHVHVRGEADDDWADCYFDCTVDEFFDEYKAKEVAYYSTGDGVF